MHRGKRNKEKRKKKRRRAGSKKSGKHKAWGKDENSKQIKINKTAGNKGKE
jgi:hypothetical protein